MSSGITVDVGRLGMYARRPVAVSLPVETIKQIFAGRLPIVARDPNREGRLYGTT